MIKSPVLIISLLSLSLFSCKKDDPKIFGCTDKKAANYQYKATDDNGTCKYYGKATFWYNSAGTEASVTVNGIDLKITKYYPDYDPECGATGCANFNLAEGQYIYTAVSTLNRWDGIITVLPNGCTRILLE